MNSFKKILKYEFLNILRSRWIFLYVLLIAGLSLSLLRIAGDPSKAILSLSSVLQVFIPLFASLFAAVYTYNSERFTELLLTQPIQRKNIFLARWFSLSVSLSLGVVFGVLLPFTLNGNWQVGLFISLLLDVFLTWVFVSVGLGIAVSVLDRMKGIGVVLGVWAYFAIVHDAVLLILLFAFREYPLDLLSATLGAVNPLGLCRVILLMHYDAALLLSHSGIVIRKVLGESSWGMGMALGMASVWVGLPLYLTRKRFITRDF